MKRKSWKRAVLLLTAALTCMLTGCGSGRVADASALADKLYTSLTFQDELTQATDTVRDTLYAIDSGDLAEGKLYISSGATAEEIAVFRATDKAAADRLYKAAQERLESQKAGYEDYAPAEMPKLNNALLMKKGNMVLLCVVEDHDTAKWIVDRAWK